jgi:hypothetical protein
MKKHPNNGPKFSKAPPNNRKPMTDEEIATRHARQKAEQEPIERFTEPCIAKTR